MDFYAHDIIIILRSIVNMIEGRGERELYDHSMNIIIFILILNKIFL